MNEKRISVRGIILKDDVVYFIHRIKENADYYVFPGGGLESGETLIECLYRELKEEINIDALFIKELYVLEGEASIEHYMLCSHIDGEFGISNGPEYTSNEYQNSGKFIPCMLKKDQLQSFNIVPEIIKTSLIKDLDEHGDLKELSTVKFEI